jgi:diguanylate cyclase (GGDEF)-like protein/PAS domain S-box-containing protein
MCGAAPSTAGIPRFLGPVVSSMPVVNARHDLGLLAPYGACLVAVWGLIGLESRVRVTEVVVALALQLLVGAALFASRGPKEVRWAGIAGIATFVASVALLRDGVGQLPGYGALLPLAMVWAALRGRRDELWGALVLSALMLFVPIVAIGGSHYPQTGFRTGGLLVVVGAVLGITVLTLVERLRASEAHYRLLADNSTDLVARMDLEGRVLYASAACDALLGLQPAELVGRRLADLMHPDERPARAAEVERIDASPHMRLLEFRMRHRDGRWLSFEASVRAVRDQGGAVVERQATIRLVEERARMQRDLQRNVQQFRALARSVPSGFVLLFDCDLRYLIADGPALADFGLTAADVEGRTVGDVFVPARAAVLESRYRAALAGTEQRWEHHTHDGRAYEMRAVAVRDAGGQVFAGAVVTVDVTERAQHEAEAGALRRIATLVATGAQPDAIFTTVAEETAALFDATLGAVVRFDVPAGVGVVVGAATTGAGTLAGVAIDLRGTSAIAKVARSGAAARVDGYHDGAPDPVFALAGLTGAVCSPIYVGGQLWGSVGAGFVAVAPPSDAHVRLARIAELVSVAIASAEAWDTLAGQAATDSVTGLANHRAFHERLRAEAERADRYGRDLSVAIFDLDHFKQINDLHGHQTGDAVLGAVAQRLRAQARASDLVARIGGEEFAWLMPETTGENAYGAAERARLAIASTAFDGVGVVTISAGVCSSRDARNAAELLDLADRALYDAKDGGRNNVRRHTPAQTGGAAAAAVTPHVADEPARPPAMR